MIWAARAVIIVYFGAVAYLINRFARPSAQEEYDMAMRLLELRPDYHWPIEG